MNETFTPYNNPDAGTPAGIVIHGPDEFEGMRKAGRLAAECLDMITEHVVPGATTDDLNRICHLFTLDHGAVPAPLGYRGFPKSICTSVNHVVCHGIPGDKVLREGDVVNIDVTPILDGWYGDSSRMYPVGKIGVKAQRLIDVTYESLMKSIESVKAQSYKNIELVVIDDKSSDPRYHDDKVIESLGGLISNGIRRSKPILLPRFLWVSQVSIYWFVVCMQNSATAVSDA